MDHENRFSPEASPSGATVSSAFRSLPRAKRAALLLIAAAVLTVTAVISGLIGRGTVKIPVVPADDIMARAIKDSGETTEDTADAAVAAEPETDAPTAPPTEPPTTEAPTEPTTAEPTTEETTTVPENARDYVVNTNTGKFHYPYCSSVGDMNPANRSDRTCSRDDLIAEGYVPCKRCSP